MKRTIFLFLISALFLGQTASADQQFSSTCLGYNNKECTQVKYCSSPSLNGCNFYELCTLNGDKYSCVPFSGSSDKKIYRDKSFMDKQYLNIYKEHYTSPIAEEYMEEKHISDKMGYSMWNHNDEKANSNLQIQSYYHLDQNGQYNFIPRHNLQENNYQPPYNPMDKDYKLRPRGWTLYH